MSGNNQKAWEKYRETELSLLRPALAGSGIELDEVQPHIGGERFLMMAVGTESGQKLILLGAYNGQRAVIKATRDARGERELQKERTARAALNDIAFAYDVFHTPPELYFGHLGPFLVSVQAYIPQESTFLARPTAEQFSFALAALKAQESAHAATHEHVSTVRRTFGVRSVADYMKSFRAYMGVLSDPAFTFFIDNARTIEQYSGFLTHTDFVPHNFRIAGSTMYLLDHSSLRFGNKHEGWARFINFMALHNPELARALVRYVADNRASEEVLSLKLMRLYKLAEIVYYYRGATEKSDGDLKVLNERRIAFWSSMRAAVAADDELPPNEIEAYVAVRDALRSNEEKQRQQDLL